LLAEPAEPSYVAANSGNQFIASTFGISSSWPDRGIDWLQTARAEETDGNHTCDVALE
jgi:hypothetical protein